MNRNEKRRRKSHSAGAHLVVLHRQRDGLAETPPHYRRDRDIKGFVELDAIGGLTLTVEGRAVLGELLKAATLTP